MTFNTPSFDAGISEPQFDAFRRAVEFWRHLSDQYGVEFEWVGPRRRPPNAAIIGNGEVGFRIRSAAGGYEIVTSRERESAQEPTFYSRYDDSVKDVARVLGTTFRMRTRDRTWLTWRDSLAPGVVRQDIGDGLARYSLVADPSVYCVIGSYDGDEFSPALTMTIDEFNLAILEDPGVRPPGRRL